MSKKIAEEAKAEAVLKAELKEELDDSYFTLNKEIESYNGKDAAFLIGKLKELDLLTQHPGFQNTYMSTTRLIGRTIKKKLLLISITNVYILDTHAPQDVEEEVAATKAAEAVATEAAPGAYPGPNMALIAWRKQLIDAEFTTIGVPPFHPLDPDNSVYTDYLRGYDGIRIFTLKSYDNEHTPHDQCLQNTFIPDGTYDVGSYNIDNDPVGFNHRKYYERGNFDTENLLRAIIYRRNLPPDSKINLLTLSYTYDPDADDLQEQARDNFFSIYTVYGIVKRMTAFFATGRIDTDMRYLKALKAWLEDPDGDLGDSIITAFLLKRIGVMTELLWYVLYRWPIIISPCPPDTNPPINPCNIKLYAGIGTSTRDANYQVFIAGLFPGAANPADEDPYAVVAANPHDSGEFHTNPGLPPAVPGQPQITSRDFVSTAYSFDAATRFCKPGPIPPVFCMLEFILEPDTKLPFIGSSANEAEVLLKPGNVYQFIKRYRVKYFRHSFTGSQEMLIYIYQFLLVADMNTILTFPRLPHDPHDPLDPDPLDPELYTRFDYNNHRDWSIRVNDLMRVFGVMANTDLGRVGTIDGSSLDPHANAGGSKTNRKSKSKRRQHNKRRKTKRRQYKRQTNKRRKTKRRTNKRRTNKRRTNKRRRI
jgi:hypothetical protein